MPGHIAHCGGGSVSVITSDEIRRYKRTRSLTGHNLLHAAHVEYGFPDPTREQIVRSVFGRITWGY